MQVAQLAKAALDVRHVDLNVILEATEEPRKKRERASGASEQVRLNDVEKSSRITAAGFSFT